MTEANRAGIKALLEQLMLTNIILVETVKKLPEPVLHLDAEATNVMAGFLATSRAAGLTEKDIVEVMKRVKVSVKEFGIDATFDIVHDVDHFDVTRV